MKYIVWLFVIIFLFEIQKPINTQKCEICQIQYVFLNIEIVIPPRHSLSAYCIPSIAKDKQGQKGN